MKNIILEDDLKYYIAGLFEGDGHIWIPNSNIKKKALPRWHITAHVKDAPLITHLLKLIGHGFIRNKIKDNAVVLTIGNRQGILKIIEWLNGRLYTPKLIKFNLMIDWMNLNDNCNIVKLPLIDPSMNNYWFSGFVDADGHFKIRTTLLNTDNNNKKERFATLMSIDQRIIDPLGGSYLPIMDKIKDTFAGKLITVIKKGNSYYHLNFNNYTSLDLIHNYFSKFSLFSSKYLDYICWRDAFLIRRNIPVLSQVDKQNIINLKSQMNSQRTYFSWQHLPIIKN